MINFTYHNKKWNPVFFTKRKFNEDHSYVRTLQDSHPDRNNLDLFLDEYEGEVPSYINQEVKEFYQSTLQPVEQQKAKVWLNDCAFSTKTPRNYEHRLTADQLHILLLCKVR